VPVTREELGKRIAAARERAGLTQAQLAREVGLTQSAVSRIESGERSVDSLELAAIADRLGISVLDLLDDRPVPEQLLAFAGRIQTARSPGAVDVARQRVLDLVRFHRLLSDLGVPPEEDPPLPAIRPRSKNLAVEQGADLARQARKALDLGDQPLPDLVELVEDLLGVDVAIERLPEGVEGLSIRFEDFALALVRAQPVAGRERFTLAHEVAHLLAGDAQPLYLDEDLFGQGTEEMRANVFAAHFLMPPDGLRRRIRGRTVDGRVVCELQYAFGVSLYALLWHLRNLDLITHAQHEELKATGPKALALRHGYLADWEVSYRAGLRSRPPGRLLRRAMHAYRRGLIGVERLASLLGIGDCETLQRDLEEAGIASEGWPEDTAPA
jgi:Zn-dependent peptidase ImmA (M78 family)/DNA-binding XRE family transcriptional regulator